MRFFRSFAFLLLPLLLQGCDQLNLGRGGEEAAETVVVENAGDYIGEYTRSDGTPIYFAERDGGLVVVVTGNVFALRPEGEDSFSLIGVPETVRFERDGEGLVVSVTDSQGTYPRASRDLPEEIARMFPADEAGASYAYQPPTRADDDLPVGRAGDHGLAPAVIEGVVTDILGDPEYRHVHALLVQKGGVLVAEEYFGGYTEGEPHNLRSATKSVISALVGAAQLRGLVSMDDRPLAVIAGQRGTEISDHKASLTLGDMLDMRHGLQCDDWEETSPGNESRIYGEEDWTAFILDIPEAEEEAPAASYCSAMPLMVGRYLEIAAGEPLATFADEALFTPLGIGRGDWSWDFELAAQDTPHGAQVHLRPRDMLRFANLYRRDGLTDEGTRLLPEGWVEESLNAAMLLGDWRRYNDYWWAYDIEREGAAPLTVHMASGVGGQRIALVPGADLVVVMTGGSFTEGRGGPRKVIERLASASAP